MTSFDEWVIGAKTPWGLTPHGALLALPDCVFYAASVHAREAVRRQACMCSDDALACRIHLGARRAEPLLHIQRLPVVSSTYWNMMLNSGDDSFGEDTLRQLGENMACLVKATRA